MFCPVHEPTIKNYKDQSNFIYVKGLIYVTKLAAQFFLSFQKGETLLPLSDRLHFSSESAYSHANRRSLNDGRQSPTGLLTGLHYRIWFCLFHYTGRLWSLLTEFVFNNQFCKRLVQILYISSTRQINRKIKKYDWKWMTP